VKKLMLVIFGLLLALSCPGCQGRPITESLVTTDAFQLKDITADRIMISSMQSSYLLIEENRNLVDELVDRGRSCRFVSTEQEIDIASIYEVTYLVDNKILEKIYLDKNGICWIKGRSGQYKINDGQLNYDRVVQIFKQGEKAGSTGS
jgi:hypothetical protein